MWQHVVILKVWVLLWLILKIVFNMSEFRVAIRLFPYII